MKTVFSDSAYQLTKYFAHGNYEREMGDENRELHYIFAGTGIAAIMQRKNNVDSKFYVHPDHLVSLVLITDENGNVYEEKSFDAFGRMRDLEDWDEIVNGVSYRFDRGFTGHEHLNQFGLINMNGRMYDSHTARFLSPDLFVQDPAFTQSFNRYSYCVNNPLRFVDQGGYWWNGLTDRVFHDGQTDWSRKLHPQHRHLDSEGGYSYDPKNKCYKNSSGQIVSFQEVYYKFILPNLSSDAFINIEEYYYAGRGTRLGKNLIKVNPNGNLDVWSVFTTTFYGVVSFNISLEWDSNNGSQTKDQNVFETILDYGSSDWADYSATIIDYTTNTGIGGGIQTVVSVTNSSNKFWIKNNITIEEYFADLFFDGMGIIVPTAPFYQRVYEYIKGVYIAIDNRINSNEWWGGFYGF